MGPDVLEWKTVEGQLIEWCNSQGILCRAFLVTHIRCHILHQWYSASDLFSQHRFHMILNNEQHFSMFHRAFFNSIIDKHQHMHFTFNNILV